MREAKYFYNLINSTNYKNIHKERFMQSEMKLVE